MESKEIKAFHGLRQNPDFMRFLVSFQKDACDLEVYTYHIETWAEYGEGGTSMSGSESIDISVLYRPTLRDRAVDLWDSLKYIWQEARFSPILTRYILDPETKKCKTVRKFKMPDFGLTSFSLKMLKSPFAKKLPLSLFTVSSLKCTIYDWVSEIIFGDDINSSPAAPTARDGVQFYNDAYTKTRKKFTPKKVRDKLGAEYVELSRGVYMDSIHPTNIVIDEKIHNFDLPDGWSHKFIFGKLTQALKDITRNQHFRHMLVRQIWNWRYGYTFKEVEDV